MIQFLGFFFIFIILFVLIFILFVVGMLQNILMAPFRKRRFNNSFRQPDNFSEGSTVHNPNNGMKSGTTKSRPKFDKSQGQYVDFEDVSAEP